jgi:hypothetical protein
MTIDQDLQETPIDLVQNFTALIIMITIDNQLLNKNAEQLKDVINTLSQKELLKIYSRELEGLARARKTGILR